MSTVDRFARGWIEQELSGIGRTLEIEHAGQRTGECVEGAWYSLTFQPIIFDEAQNRRLVAVITIGEVEGSPFGCF